MVPFSHSTPLKVLEWLCVALCDEYLKQCLTPTGLERDKFDNKTVTFEEHIKVEHNMWHYLFFIVLVKVKDHTEYTGPESYVAEMIRVRSLCLPLALLLLQLYLFI